MFEDLHSQVEGLNKKIFHILDRFRFTLRGADGNGVWQVTITDDEGTRTIPLSDTAQMYFATSKRITIECQNAGGAMIYFESFTKVDIRKPDEWDSWSCDDLNNKNDGDFRCNRVREGNFNWNSIYEITFTGLPGNIIA